MKNHIRALLTLSIVMLLTTACGQKGPLIVDVPSTNGGKPSSKEVTEKDSVLNTQTEEISSTR